MGWHHMDGWNWAWMTIVMVGFWVGVGLLVWVALRRRGGTDLPTPEETLRQRLARGDIDPEEYERRLSALHPPERVLTGRQLDTTACPSRKPLAAPQMRLRSPETRDVTR